MNVTEHTFDFEQTFKERLTEFKEDPLVLSVSLKKISTPDQYYAIDNPRVVENIDNEIRNTAEAIRTYYGKKFFWQNLKDGNGLSDFRRRVCYLLENRIQSCKDQDIGIYFKLPWFYEEDMIYDEFKKNYCTTNLPRIGYGAPTSPKEVLKLKYIRTSVSTQRKRKIERFWFTNEKYLYAIEVEASNPLIYMLKDMLLKKEEHCFETYLTQDRIDQLHYYKLFQFNFAREDNA